MYEMRIPPGVSYSSIAKVVNKYNLKLVQTDDGPVLRGKKEDLEKAKDLIVKDLKKRIKELEK
ncbi:conserved hypothetical protein [Methanothermus fervidus DSM 2088]|uniref:Uncharacterized protein n=1 Tax=Methanothermus fervidus (strain ATCC 43054 / DSM 2088 / JCM 10308 / V24 S) TaxID=523846 RepID=E3GZ68_METFV|nr:hypothetical protein [Methanothermus fervidus]ADP77600.1 conserved hypothetical protein [Methanothermus fervidus DSM 2088]